MIASSAIAGLPAAVKRTFHRSTALRIASTQATTNFLETFPLFAALVFAARVTGHHSLLTVLGAHFYFWGRLGYLLAAAAGFSLVRSVLCWNIAVIGILLFVIALIWELPPVTPSHAMKRIATAEKIIFRD